MIFRERRLLSFSICHFPFVIFHLGFAPQQSVRLDQ